MGINLNKRNPQYGVAFENHVKNVMETYDAVGIAVAIIDKEGTLYEKYFGYKNDEKEGIDQDTIFGLASITKSFTCLSIMQMAEKGILDIDDPVTKYVPEYKNQGQDTVKIKHLMSHCAGYYPFPRITIEAVAKDLGITEAHGDYAYSEILAQEGIRLVAERLDKSTERIGKPGEYTSYSNDSYALLSDIIRRHGSETSYGAYVKKNILEPLGMTRSGCDFIKNREDKNRATLYKHENNERKGSNNFYDNAFVLMGGGAMKSTIADMKKYVRMYLQKGIGENGNRVLDSAGIKEMTMGKYFFKFQQMYGFGFSTKYMDDLTIVEHGGSLPGVSSNIAFCEELELGVIVLCNTSGVAVADISNKALKWCNGKDPMETKEIFNDCQWEKDTIEKACGTYLSGEGNKIVIEKKGAGVTLFSNEIEMQTRIVQPRMLLASNKMSSIDVRLYMDEKEVWAIGYGTRIIPRAR